MRVKIDIAIFLSILNPAGKSSDKFTMEDIESILSRVETPAYVLDLNRVRENVRKITESVTYPNFQIHYAMFCNDNEELLKFLRKKLFFLFLEIRFADFSSRFLNLSTRP